MRREKPAFTLIELLLTIGIIGSIASIIFMAIAPRDLILKTRDVERTELARQMSNAMETRIIDQWSIPQWDVIPDCTPENKLTCAKRICREGETCPSSVAVSLESLVPEFIAQLPVDIMMETDDDCTGFLVYKESGRPHVFSSNEGKLPGDEPAGGCGPFIPEELALEYFDPDADGSITIEEYVEQMREFLPLVGQTQPDLPADFDLDGDVDADDSAFVNGIADTLAPDVQAKIAAYGSMVAAGGHSDYTVTQTDYRTVKTNLNADMGESGSPYDFDENGTVTSDDLSVLNQTATTFIWIPAAVDLMDGNDDDNLTLQEIVSSWVGFKAAFGAPPGAVAPFDFNRDGFINLTDFDIFRAAYQTADPAIQAQFMAYTVMANVVDEPECIFTQEDYLSVRNTMLSILGTSNTTYDYDQSGLVDAADVAILDGVADLYL